MFDIIGIGTTALILLLLLAILKLFLLAGATRLFSRASDHFYDTNSVWRMRLSGIFAALAVLEPQKVPAVWREAKTFVEDDEA